MAKKFDLLRVALPAAGLISLASVLALIWTLASADAQNRRGVAVARTQKDWRAGMRRLPKQAPGCYVANFPRIEWVRVTCGPAPQYPIIPTRGPARHFVVGGGGSNDFAANPTGTIRAAEGTFVDVQPSGTITESGPIANSGPSIANAYTLQINTNELVSSACAGSPNTNCRGWEQFVYVNDPSSHFVFIQYWLLRYNATCPAGWNQFTFSGGTTIYCYQSTTTASLTAGQPVSNLGNMTLSAAVDSANDSVSIDAGGGNMAQRVGVNAVAAAAGWTDAEFNIFGDGGNSSGGGQAGFGPNTSLTVRTTVHNGTRNAPGCNQSSFTGETNNLNLVGMNPIPTQPAPAIEFTESNVLTTAAACMRAAGVGDTHLSTFGGLFYDFQAAGDFILAEAKDFLVEERQVSGAPTWPDASVNKAAAARFGKDEVAICSPEASQIMVNGRPETIADGSVFSTPAGLDVKRIGNVYLAIDQNGNSMTATLNGTYMDVSVGLGRWPTKVRGLLANAGNNPSQLMMRTGQVINAPFAFGALYGKYAQSWQGGGGNSPLRACGTGGKFAIPRRPLYAANLDPVEARRARAVCIEAGVRHKGLLDACTLDVVVLRRKDAARVFAELRKPLVVGLVRGDRQTGVKGYNRD